MLNGLKMYAIDDGTSLKTIEIMMKIKKLPRSRYTFTFSKLIFSFFYISFSSVLMLYYSTEFILLSQHPLQLYLSSRRISQHLHHLVLQLHLNSRRIAIIIDSRIIGIETIRIIIFIIEVNCIRMLIFIIKVNHIRILIFIIEVGLI